ncbi:MAG: inositol monophosphatase family protein [Rhodospirillales bacterium]|jgi:myo-inositol-1(or 4)-monophosphatase|nr:inositol monophosphatase family protein [Rhodospirillales bacterium]MDP6644945.1 inositol monophosphatase family protein [Rhodospirillales bacterium]MDP6840519.1 inositol monophosphatase family protein [Rhodospirillales bacterium]
MPLRSANLNVMIRAAREASVKLKRDYGEVDQLQVSKKGPADFVTAADIRTEKILRGELAKARPDYGFLMEEAGAVEGADQDRRWIIDPIDGTTNFVHGIAHFAMSIALQEHGKITAGIVFNPITEELFTAEAGNGAYLNDRRLRVSSRVGLDNSVFATGIPFMGRGDDQDHQRFLSEMAAVMGASAGIRRFGSAALDLAFVAAGRYDGFWESGLMPWDIAAGIILVREAGGLVTDIDGRDMRLEAGTILASNPNLHQPLGDTLRKARK